VSFSQITLQVLTMTRMSYLPRHKRFELASSRLRYRLFCRCSTPPNRDIGVAGDLYIIVADKQVFYKEQSTIDRRGKWRPATDDCVIHHPFEPSHCLTVTADRFLQWSKKRPRVGTFKSSVSHMSELLCKRRHVAPGDSLRHPIKIDID
jgi:hypothetical protein